MSTADTTTASAPGRSWRDIRREVQPLAMSRQGRRRRRLEWLKVVALCSFLAVAGWSVYEVVHSWETDRSGLATAVHSQPVREVILITTGGVLTTQWVTDALALPKSASLMALDLTALRDKLLSFPQVRAAVLTRSFPDTLVVTLQERTPVARVQADDGSGAIKHLLVARDGTVYDGFNYDRLMLAGLPWLNDIRLVRSGTGFAPIAGMEDVATLLSTAQLQAPHLYRDWLIVSLARLADQDEIIVKAQNNEEIVFSRKEDFFRQVAQLDSILDRISEQTGGTVAVQKVNLALGGQVPVTLAGTPDELAKMPPNSFSIQSSQPKAKRDL
jgi:cell division protein FtsQ